MQKFMTCNVVLSCKNVRAIVYPKFLFKKLFHCLPRFKSIIYMFKMLGIHSNFVYVRKGSSSRESMYGFLIY